MKQLHPFQSGGADWIAARRFAYLADEMGLGKTPQLAVAADRAGAKRALVIAPAIMEDDWCDTLEDFAPNRGPAHRLRDPSKIPAVGDLVTSYERAALHREALMRHKWDVVICDEAKNLKNQDAERTRAILNPIYGGRRSIASVSGAVWFADGTPIPNNPAELYPALRTAGLFDGRYWDFAYRFCEVKEITINGIRQRKITGARNVEELRQMLRGFMLRRTTAEVLPELPLLRIGEISVPGAEIDAANPILPVLRQLDEDAHDAIGASISTGDWSMRHVPHIATIRRLTGLAKAHRAVEIARIELDCAYDKIVLFGWHSDVLGYMQHQLRDFNPVMLTGAESHVKRRKAIRAFQNDPGTRVAIGQTRAAGAGITLTASQRLLTVESAWTPADNEQVEKRVHRIGQHRETFVDYLTLKGSSDEMVTAAVRQKRNASKQLLTAELTL